MPIASSLVATVGGAVGLISLWRQSREPDPGGAAASAAPELEQPRGVRHALRLGGELLSLGRREILNLEAVYTYLQIRGVSKRDLSHEVAREVRSLGKLAEPSTWLPKLQCILRLLFLSRSMAHTAHVPAPRRLENLCRSASVPQSEVLLWKMKSGVHSPAFALLRDHQLNALVLIIRGTAEKWDVLTNLTGMVQPHHIFPHVAGSLASPELGFAHRGLVASAHRLCKEHLLNQQDPKLLNAVREDCNRGLDLLICGHSLGAGTAAFLTAMLREQSPELSHAKCVAFACPPCATRDLSEACRPFVTTVVNSADAVPTISHKSISDYKRKLAEESAARRRHSTLGRLSGAFSACTGGLRTFSNTTVRVEQSICNRSRRDSCTSNGVAPQDTSTTAATVHRAGSTPNRLFSGALNLAPILAARNHLIWFALVHLQNAALTSPCTAPRRRGAVSGGVSNGTSTIKRRSFSVSSAENTQRHEDSAVEVAARDEQLRADVLDVSDTTSGDEIAVAVKDTSEDFLPRYELYPAGRILHVVRAPSEESIDETCSDNMGDSRLTHTSMAEANARSNSDSAAVAAAAAAAAAAPKTEDPLAGERSDEDMLDVGEDDDQADDDEDDDEETEWAQLFANRILTEDSSLHDTREDGPLASAANAAAAAAAAAAADEDRDDEERAMRENEEGDEVEEEDADDAELIAEDVLSSSRRRRKHRGSASDGKEGDTYSNSDIWHRKTTSAGSSSSQHGQSTSGKQTPVPPEQPCVGATESENQWELYTDVDLECYNKLRISRTMRTDHRQKSLESRLQSILNRMRKSEVSVEQDK